MPPDPGTKLAHEGQNAAEITSAAYSPKLREVVALAYVRTEAVQNRPILTVAGSSTEAHLS
jgi:glycine cleavage system aminomethyltransferase T